MLRPLDQSPTGRVNDNSIAEILLYKQLYKTCRAHFFTCNVFDDLLSGCNAGNSSFISPASSVISLNGPDLPSRPTSPWTSDFYDSEFESADRSGTETGRSRRRNEPATLAAATTNGPTTSQSATARNAPQTATSGMRSSSKQTAGTNFPHYRSQNLLEHGPPYAWPASEPSTLDRQRRDASAPPAPRDLFDLARRRRQDAADRDGSGYASDQLENDWTGRSHSLPRTNSAATGGNFGGGGAKTFGGGALTAAASARRPNHEVKTLRSSSGPSAVTALMTSSQPTKVQQQQQQPPRRTESASPSPRFQRLVTTRGIARYTLVFSVASRINIMLSIK